VYNADLLSVIAMFPGPETWKSMAVWVDQQISQVLLSRLQEKMKIIRVTGCVFEK
jgi:hypothetical protein